MKQLYRSFVWKILPLTLLVLLFCNGCWDKKEFNQLAIAQTIAVDYDKGQYELTIQLVMPTASDTDVSSDSMWIIQGNGESVAEAMEQISRSAPRELYLDHLDIVLLGEGLLQHDVRQGMEYLIQEDVLRRRTSLLAVKGNAGALLQTKQKLADVDIYYLRNLLRDQRQWVKGGDTVINDYYLAMDGRLPEGLVIPQIQEKEGTALYLNGAAVIYENRLLCWKEQDWLNSYRWVTGGAEITTLPASESHEEVTVELRKERCRWEMVSEKPLKVRAVLQGTIMITENSADEEQHTMAERDLLQQQIQKEVESMQTVQIKQDFAAMQKEQCDVLHLGRWLQARYPHLVEGDNWPQQFSEAEMEVKMDTEIKSRV